MTNESFAAAVAEQESAKVAEKTPTEPAQPTPTEEVTPEPVQETAEQVAAKEAEAERRAEKRAERRERKQFYEMKAKLEYLERERERNQSQSQPQEEGSDESIDSIVAKKIAEIRQQEEASKFFERSTKLLEKAMEIGDFDPEDFIELPPAAANAIVEMDNPKIVAHLQQNPELIEKLSKMSPYLQAVEIGRLDTQLSAPKPAVKKSGAPAPIAPIGGKNASNGGYTPDMSDADFAKARREKKLIGR